MKGKAMLLATVAGFVFTLAGAQPARADYRDRQRECYRKVEREEFKLEKEIRKHGYYSRQARHQREKLSRLRYECGGRYGYGNGRRDDGWDRDHDRDGRDDRWERDHRRGNDNGWMYDRSRRPGPDWIWRNGRWVRR